MESPSSPSGPAKEPRSPPESSSAAAPTSCPAPASSGDSAPPSDSSPPTLPSPSPPAAPPEAARAEPTNILDGTGWEWKDKPAGNFKDWSWCPAWLLPEELRPPSAAEATPAQTSPRPAEPPSQSPSGSTIPGQEPLVHRVGSKSGSLDGSKSAGSRDTGRRTGWGGLGSSAEALEEQGHYTLVLERGLEEGSVRSASSDCSIETPGKFVVVLDAHNVSLNQYHNLRSRP